MLQRLPCEYKEEEGDEENASLNVSSDDCEGECELLLVKLVKKVLLWNVLVLAMYSTSLGPETCDQVARADNAALSE